MSLLLLFNDGIAPTFVAGWAIRTIELRGMKKNAASQKVGAQMVSASDGSAFTGAVTVSVTIDAGAQATGSVGAGACTHEGNGYHTYAPAQAETNGDLVAFTFTGTGAIPQTVQMYTTFPQTGDAYAETVSGTYGLSAIKTQTAAIEVDTADIQTRLPAALTGAGNIKADALAFGGTTYATALAAEVDAVWDEVITGGVHNTANSAGRRLRLIDAAFEVHAGTAQSGSTATTFVMDTGASATNDIYNGDRIVIIAGTGVEEHGLITDYVGATRTATMSKSWVVTPDATSEFAVLPADTDVGSWNNTAVTGDGDWSELQTDVDAILVDTGTTLDARIPASLTADGNMRADTLRVGGTLQTAGDLAALVTTVDTVVDAIKVKTDNLPAAPAAVGDIPTATQNADALLNRDMSAVTVTNARSPINALRWLRNKWSNSGGTLTVYKEDDVTTAWTATTTTAASDPVDSVDPA